jgi:hypothetical protein
LREEFENVDALIEYTYIERLIISINEPFLFQLHMSEEKPVRVPAKMNIHCLERRYLINFIRFSWKTDFMVKRLEIRDMPVYKTEFKDTISEDT